MTNDEFAREMDVIYENINKDGAVGLDEYEKSVILTNAQEKLVHQLSALGDLSLLATLIENVKVPSSITDTIVANKGVGLETALPSSPSATGDTYVSSDTFKLFTATDSVTWDDGVLLIKGVYVTDTTTNNLYYFDGIALLVVGVAVFPSASAKFDPNGTIFEIPKPYVRIIAENVVGADDKNIAILPITMEQHTMLTSKPYRYPKRRTAWRIIQGYSTTSKEEGASGVTVKSSNVELIGPHGVTLTNYTAQLLLQPQPIILEDLEPDVTIRGLAYKSETNIIESLHPTILEYAVTLAEKYYFDKYNTKETQAQ